MNEKVKLASVAPSGRFFSLLGHEMAQNSSRFKILEDLKNKHT